MRREWRRCSEVRSSRRCSAGRARSPPSLATALRGLPAGIMRGPELRLVLLALVLCQAPLGPAAPVSVGGGTVLAKMYPRGNHWAVGECPGGSVVRSGSLRQSEGTWVWVCSETPAAVPQNSTPPFLFLRARGSGPLILSRRFSRCAPRFPRVPLSARSSKPSLDADCPATCLSS